MSGSGGGHARRRLAFASPFAYQPRPSEPPGHQGMPRRFV